MTIAVPRQSRLAMRDEVIPHGIEDRLDVRVKRATLVDWLLRDLALTQLEVSNVAAHAGEDGRLVALYVQHQQRARLRRRLKADLVQDGF